MSSVNVSADALAALISGIFKSLGAKVPDAELLADSLVSADLEGVASHGVMLVPMYVQRVQSGSVSLTAEPSVIEDFGGLVGMSAGNGFGQISSQVAVDLAIARAREHGVSVVTVKEAFHFGAAGYWARQFSDVGMVGFAFSNTRPLMPAPGGAERLVGNNPLAIAFPADAGRPVVVDMAMSASAMGKIRLAQGRGEPIPEGWATDADGSPTTSASEAIGGMLQPAAGPKGFGLAVAIELLTGALSGGGVGGAVKPLYGELNKPYNCSHTFIAIDAGRTAGGTGIAGTVNAFSDGIRQSRRAPGVDTVYAPGDLERARRRSNGGRCTLSQEVAGQLNELGRAAGMADDLLLK